MLLYYYLGGGGRENYPFALTIFEDFEVVLNNLWKRAILFSILSLKPFMKLNDFHSFVERNKLSVKPNTEH